MFLYNIWQDWRVGAYWITWLHSWDRRVSVLCFVFAVSVLLAHFSVCQDGTKRRCQNQRTEPCSSSSHKTAHNNFFTDKTGYPVCTFFSVYGISSKRPYISLEKVCRIVILCLPTERFPYDSPFPSFYSYKTGSVLINLTLRSVCVTIVAVEKQ
jgi:hypothetical protein